jgi:hypothetical protein
MILVKDVIFEDVPGDIAEIHHMLDDAVKDYDFNKIDKYISYEKELVNGYRFINERGEKFYIGHSKAVCNLIGVPLKSFGKLEKEIQYLNNKILMQSHFSDELVNEIAELKDENEITRNINSKLNDEVQDIKYMSFWKRLKFLFTKEI